MRQVTDVAELEEFLNRDWTWTGFAMGDLEPELMLNVEDTNDRAKRVYERLGFESALVYLDGECVRVE